MPFEIKEKESWVGFRDHFQSCQSLQWWISYQKMNDGALHEPPSWRSFPTPCAAMVDIQSWGYLTVSWLPSPLVEWSTIPSTNWHLLVFPSCEEVCNENIHWCSWDLSWTEMQGENQGLSELVRLGIPLGPQHCQLPLGNQKQIVVITYNYSKNLLSKWSSPLAFSMNQSLKASVFRPHWTDLSPVS